MFLEIYMARGELCLPKNISVTPNTIRVHCTGIDPSLVRVHFCGGTEKIKKTLLDVTGGSIYFLVNILRCIKTQDLAEILDRPMYVRRSLEASLSELRGDLPKRSGLQQISRMLHSGRLKIIFFFFFTKMQHSVYV